LYMTPRVEEPDVAVVSEKGQVVIPAYLRNRFGIKPRTKLLVYGLEDAIVLKKLTIPDMRKEMEELWREIDKRIERYGELSEEEIQEEIEKHRAGKRKRSAKGT